MNTKILRQKILDLAIRGRLVPQDPNDEPAAVLLQRIHEEKQRLVKEKKLKKKDLETSPIAEEDIPFQLPQGWEWVTIKDICSKIGSGSTPRGSNYSESGIPFFRSQNVYNHGLVYDDIKYISESTHKSMVGTEVLANDLLLNITGGSLGRCAVVPEDFERGNVSQHVCILRTVLVVPAFLHCFVTSNYFAETMVLSGSGREGLPKYSLEAMFLPLPPLSEQRRIVSAVEKWMSVIDALETSAADLQQFTEIAKKRILDLAIRGKLVPQDSNDEPAAILLENIRKEKEKLVKEKKLKKKDLETTPIDKEDIPFQLPQGWEWCRLKEIAEIVRGGSPRPIKNYLTESSDGLNWIKIGDTEKGGKYIRTAKEKIIKEGLSKTRFIRKGTFLLTNSMSFGRPYITLIDGCIHDGWLAITPKEGTFIEEYLYYLLSSSFVFDQFSLAAAGAVVQNLNSDKVAVTLIPLPPLSEQRRIVSKVEDLFAAIDTIAQAVV